VSESKVKVMCDRICLINPEIKIHTLKERCSSKKYSMLIENNVDYLIDAIDSVEDKVSLLKFCFDSRIPVVSCMGTAGKLNPTAFKVADIANTSVCPLARLVRKKLRKLGITSGIKVIYSDEISINKKDLKCDYINKCCNGSISFVPSVAGLIAASVVVNDIIKF